MRVSDDELLAVLREMRAAYPDWRLGQLVSNLAAWAKGADQIHIWDIEDSELVEAAQRHLRSRADRH